MNYIERINEDPSVTPAVGTSYTSGLAINAVKGFSRNFVGRQEEIEKLSQLVRSGSRTIVGIFGADGLGKTDLARRLAHELSDVYPIRLEFNMMKETGHPRPPAEAMKYIIGRCRSGYRISEPENEESITEDYISALDNLNVLLVLDNAASEKQVEPLTHPLGCTLIITSSTTFHLAGMHSCNLSSLPLYYAKKMILDAAPRVNDRDASEIAVLCDRMPVCLGMAGGTLANTRDLEPQDYIKILKDRSSGDSKRIVREVWSVAYDNLPADLLEFWCQLSVFRGYFKPAAVASVLELDQSSVQEQLSELLKWNLLGWSEEVARYKLLELLRLYADDQLDDADREIIHRNHANYYSEVIKEASSLFGSGEGISQGLYLFDEEWENIRAGHAWAANHLEKDQLAKQLCNDYAFNGYIFHALRLTPKEWIGWLEVALRAALEMQNKLAEISHMCNLGIAYRHLGKIEKAIEYTEGARKIAHDNGYKRYEIEQFANLGVAYYELGDVRKAVDFFQKGVTESDALEDWQLKATNQCGVGLALHEIGETKQAIATCDSALSTLKSKDGTPDRLMTVLGILGNLHYENGSPQNSIDKFDEAFAIAEEIGDFRWRSEFALELGLIFEREKEYAKAYHYVRIARDYQRDSGHRDAEKTSDKLQEIQALL
jgi:tetratricopeptide (TPR) repeat protein